VGSDPEASLPNGQYAGKQYDYDTANIRAVLGDLDTYVPGASGYEIAGFFYWQGYNDLIDKVYARRYEHNLVQFIQSLRKDFQVPNAPFVIATVGFGGYDMIGDTLRVWEAQMAVDGNAGNYPEFQDNVKTVDIRASWRPAETQGHHYGLHAETYMEVGTAMGEAMLELLQKGGQGTGNNNIWQQIKG
jgi:hypothetical protein